MIQISRREFLKMGASLAILMGMSTVYNEVLAEGIDDIVQGRHRIIWLQGQGCTGCSVSFLNSTFPSPASILINSASLVFHPSVSAAQGELAVDIVRQNIQNPGYILIFEGAIPLKMPRACMFDERPLEDILLPAIGNAAIVMGIGTCAAFGGMPAALDSNGNNPTGAVSLPKFMEEKHLKKENLLILPTCPVHPESLVGCLVYSSKFIWDAKKKQWEIEKLKTIKDTIHRPKMFYSQSIHAECPRYHYYQNQEFAFEFGEEHACLFKLGCLGPLSYANCPRRQWNNGANWCIRANAPCIACSSEHFCRDKNLPFYRKGEKNRLSQTHY